MTEQTMTPVAFRVEKLTDEVRAQAWPRGVAGIGRFDEARRALMGTVGTGTAIALPVKDAKEGERMRGCIVTTSFRKSPIMRGLRFRSRIMSGHLYCWLEREGTKPSATQSVNAANGLGRSVEAR